MTHCSQMVCIDDDEIVSNEHFIVTEDNNSIEVIQLTKLSETDGK